MAASTRSDLTGADPSPATALRVAGLVKRYGPNTVLDGVDLTLDRGEVRGLVGENGAGKTTLLRIILGLVTADAGSVTVTGAPVAGIIEAPAFYPYLSARTNLELLSDYDRGAGADRIDWALDAVGLAKRASQRVAGFSSGMRQRLGIAAALIRGPRLLLLDEPTSALDPDGVADTVALIRRLAEQEGVATLISSHQLDVLAGLVDSTSRLADGRIIPAELDADPNHTL
jgi:ABC-2 type transport system ATP-binding protein